TPDEFRLDRSRGRHVAFGYGVHFCIGAPLARLEARVAMTALLARAARIERGAGETTRLPSHLLRGFEHLSLRLRRYRRGHTTRPPVAAWVHHKVQTCTSIY